MAKQLRGEVDAELGGQKYTLRLGMGDLEELDKSTGLGTLELLLSFRDNAKVTNVIKVLSQALHIDGKRVPVSRARMIIENAGWHDAVTAAVTILTAVLVDPDPSGNADAAGVATVPTTPAA